MRPRTLDHVALWAPDRDRLAAFATAHLGMHVIERTERFTLVGADARRGKLTLFAAEGPRERGALAHVALRVTSLDEAAARLPRGVAHETPRPGELYLDVDGLGLGLVERPDGADYDLDHVALFSATPAETRRRYLELGFAPAADGLGGEPRVEVGGAWIEFRQGDPGAPEQPLLHHVAVLVDSAEEHREEAERRGVPVADFVDAPNTLAVFLWAPEHVKIEYVEHKASFSLV
jgi:catechol 2,3-dioxygenase-like lactoylglutathione lyase family enzyme